MEKQNEPEKSKARKIVVGQLSLNDFARMNMKSDAFKQLGRELVKSADEVYLTSRVDYVTVSCGLWIGKPEGRFCREDEWRKNREIAAAQTTQDLDTSPGYRKIVLRDAKRAGSLFSLTFPYAITGRNPVNEELSHDFWIQCYKLK
jgi:hypothetical protein